ncbi:S8 family peptidase [Robertmurraya sp. FSL R5-0851]|uniref:S8 family peptidase n=1 Tax=Robertmurraya sp. FSL R5-0851 TaxID=2921584 RepID=UPI0030F8F891
MNKPLLIILSTLVILLTFFILTNLPPSNIEVNSDSSIIKVAILDSGINNDLQTNSFNVVKEFNTFDSSSNVNDDFGHGTAIASILIDVPQNEKIQVYDIKVLNEKGTGDVKNLIAGIEWAMEETVDVINVSLGLHKDNQMLEDVIKKALQKDIIVVASSGNNHGLFIDYPARYKGVISVSSLKNNNEKVFSSESGKIDLVDYGMDIEAINNNGKTENFSGTSFATANATRKIIALILAGEIPKSNNELISNIEENTIDLGAKGKDEKFGFGLLKELN